MTNLTTKLNKLVIDDSPSEKLINACAEIDIESCFDPIFEPPIDFLEECRKRWENPGRMPETLGKPNESFYRYGRTKNRKYLVSAGDCM